jgi:hypothetical protein
MVTEIMALTDAVGDRGSVQSQALWIRALIEFVNTGKLTVGFSGEPEKVDLPLPDISPWRWVTVRSSPLPSSPEQENYRKELRAVLAQIVTGDALPSNVMRTLVEGAAQVTIRVLGIDIKDRTPKLSYHAKSVAAIGSYLALIIYKERQLDQGFPGDLRQCQFEPCGRFFFRGDYEDPVGGRPRIFCSKECMDEHHQKTGALRVQKHRLDKKVQPFYEQGKTARSIARMLGRSENDIQESIKRLKKRKK